MGNVLDNPRTSLTDRPTDAPTPTLSGVPTEIRMQIFGHAVPKGILSFVEGDKNRSEYKGVMRNFQDQPLSLSFTIINKKMHGECMEVFWKLTVVDLTNVISHHDFDRFWDSPLSCCTCGICMPSPRALPPCIAEKAKHVRLNVRHIRESTICKALEEFEEWSQLQRIDVVSARRPVYWSPDRNESTWTSTIEDLFGAGGPLSHVVLELPKHLDCRSRRL